MRSIKRRKGTITISWDVIYGILGIVSILFVAWYIWWVIKFGHLFGAEGILIAIALFVFVLGVIVVMFASVGALKGKA